MRLKQIGSGAWRILAPCTERGDCELIEFLVALPPNLVKDGRRLIWLFDRVNVAGPPHDAEISRQEAPGLWAFRAGRLRVLWFYDEGRVIVCSHGFVKRSEKAPRREIERALAARDRYRAAKAAGRLRIEVER